MRFRILGPLEVCCGGEAVQLTGARPRALLAYLVMRANEPVGVDELAMALFGADTATDASTTIRVYVSRLRRMLGEADTVLTTPTGYLLQADPADIDAVRFERLLSDGANSLHAGRADEAATALGDALALWRGPALHELSSSAAAAAEIARLEEQRLAAVELRIDADLALGHDSQIVGELRGLVAQHPWRERLHEQLMLALYRSGRQADALAVYREARAVLVDQLGIEPGAGLRDLNQAILDQDPAIAPASDGPSVLIGPRPSHAVPVPPNRTIGRAREIAAVAERLGSGATRLLTLTGPGGVGKTRLAIETAKRVQDEFADGACFVALAGLQTADEVPDAILATLAIPVLEAETVEEGIERYLATKTLLLVLDNCEHVLDATPFVARLLSGCPTVTVLATSREPLAVQAEERWPVPPLTVADGPRHGSEAETLFAERARTHDPELEMSAVNSAATAEICRRVDGLPLAIELAAARCELLSPPEIAQRLDSVLGSTPTGMRDAPARQQTLRATIDWSYHLLTDDEQACFARFAVFAGGATIEAAETVTGAALETLERLVVKNLLTRRQGPDGRTRLLMLATIRAYASERLAGDRAADSVRERHYQYYATLAERCGAERTLAGTAGSRCLRRLDAEADNLRGALRWATGRPDAGDALRITAALGWYWLHRTRYDEAVRWIDLALAMPGAEAHATLRVRALRVKSLCIWPLGRSAEEGYAVIDEAVAIARSLGDPLVLSEALQVCAERHIAQSRLAEAERVAEEARHWATVAGDEWQIARTSRATALAAETADALRERVDRSADALERVGNLHEAAGVLAAAAYAALAVHADADARRYITRAASLARPLNNQYLPMLIAGNLGMTELFTGDLTAAASAFRTELRLSRETVVLHFAAEGLLGLAAVAAAVGDAHRSALLSGAAAAHRPNQARDDVDARIEDTFLAPAHRRASAAAWEAAATEGAALSFASAVAYALEEHADDRSEQLRTH